MGNPNGNLAGLAKWRAQHPDWKALVRTAQVKSFKLRREQSAIQREAEAAATGRTVSDRALGVTVQLREGGAYVAGSSRTFTLDGCPYDPDALRRVLLDLLPEIRARLAQTRETPRKQLVRW